MKSSHLKCELLEACSLEQTQSRVVDRTWILMHASKSSHLRCELFTIPQWQSDIRTCCFLFPWVPFPNFSISRLLGPILLKLSSMVNLSNERDRKLISVRTSAWHLGKRFSKVTLCIRRHERNGEISWSLIGHKTTMLRICAQSEARTQMGSWTSLVKVIAQGLSRPSCKLSLAPGFSSHLFRPFYVSLTPTICPWVSEDGQKRAPRKYAYVWETSECKCRACVISEYPRNVYENHTIWARSMR